MKEIQQVIDKYNKGQDKFVIAYMGDRKKKGKYLINIWDEINSIYYSNIGFYEWLVNPKFKVFEVLKIKTGCIMETVSLSDNEYDIIKQPEEIIKYLSGGVKCIKK